MKTIITHYLINIYFKKLLISEIVNLVILYWLISILVNSFRHTFACVPNIVRISETKLDSSSFPISQFGLWDSVLYRQDLTSFRGSLIYIRDGLPHKGLFKS